MVRVKKSLKCVQLEKGEVGGGKVKMDVESANYIAHILCREYCVRFCDKCREYNATFIAQRALHTHAHIDTHKCEFQSHGHGRAAWVTSLCSISFGRIK